MELIDYLHYYLDCDYWTTNSQGNLNAQTLPNVIDLCKRNKGVQLHLRQLEDMEKEEMIGLLQAMVPADMEDKPTPEDYDIEMFYNDDGLMVDADIAVGANYSCSCYEGQIAIKLCGSICLFDETGKDVTRDELTNVPKAFHYLLQQHFDLFGLIDAGMAIDAKNIKS
jgi:hypothetical protein